MRRLLVAAVILGILGATAFYILTMPRTVDAAALPNHTPDLANGEIMFHAGGCSSCHAAPASEKCDDHKTADKRKLAGGRCLITPFGTFYVPNISPDPEAGIGGWSDVDFINAMTRGVSPEGTHYYPAFPYTSYQRMRYEDLLDLKAFLDTLPAVKSQVPHHDLVLPFRWRRGLGLWKLLYLDGKPFSPPKGADAKVVRGAYLVEGPGHCGECHTPRDMLGGKLSDAKYSGAPAPEGKGYVPNITPDKSGIGDWSADDIVEALTTGFTPSFDSLGGSMVAVQENMAKLPAADRAAIAAYLKSVPAIASKPRKKESKAGGG
jgi:mono/diheme cytochrome c family protein